MLRKPSLALLALCAAGGAAHATCDPVPYSFANGTIWDAAQVNANFVSIRNCANSAAARGANADITSLSALTSIALTSANLAITRSFPSGFSPSTTPVAGVKVQTGTYSLANLWPNATFNGLMSIVVTPSTYTQQPYPNAAIAGIITSSNNQTGASDAGGFFLATMEAGGTYPNSNSPYGINAALSNAPAAYWISGAGQGFDVGLPNVLELNPNTWTKAGGSAPSGLLQGIQLMGGGNTKPSSGAYGIRIREAGVGQTWNIGVLCDEAATDVCLTANPVSSSNNVASQVAQFTSRDGAGVLRTGSINQLPGPVLAFTLPDVAQHAVALNSHLASSGTAPTLSSCGTSPAFVGSGTDLRGTVTPGGGGPTACTITFARAYGTTPSCVASSPATGTTVAIGAATTTSIRIDFSASLGATSFTYMCIQ